MEFEEFEDVECIECGFSPCTYLINGTDPICYNCFQKLDFGDDLENGEQ